MLKLYGGLLTRAFIVEWYLLELDVPYELICLNMQQGEHLGAEFLSVNPIGKLPVLVDGEYVLSESGAILLYLAEKHGQLPVDLQDRAKISQWIFFANSTLIDGLFVPDKVEREYPRLLAPLDRILARQPFLLGDRFGLADVAVGAVLAYIPILLTIDLAPFPPEIANTIRSLNAIDFESYPHLQDYLRRLGKRAAFQASTRPLRAMVPSA